MDTLFDSPCRYMSDSELLYEISNNRQIVSDIERSNEVRKYDKEDAPSGSPVPDSLS
jgi:DNA repair protein RadC